MEQVIINTINGIKEDLAKGKRTVKSIAAECGIFESQASGDLSKSIFARLADCTSRKEFQTVFASL
jgi:hypothetical protein